MQTPALMWLAYELTHMSRWPALVSASQLLPTFLFGAWAGSLADRWPKRSLLVCTQSALLFLAVLLMILVLVHDIEPWELLTVTLAAGVVGAVDLPTRLAFVQDLVSREDVINAVALNSVLFNSARLIGPLIGFPLLIWKGPAACFFANALSYLAVLIALLSMNVAPRTRLVKEREGLAGLFAGFAELGRRPALMFLILAAGMTSLCGWPFLSLLPALADRTLGLPKSGYGVMLSGTGFGAMSAALTVARFGSWERRRIFLGGGVSVLCAGLVGLSLVEDLPLAFVCCASAGFGLVLFFSTGQGVIQLSAAEHNRGRLLGIWAMMLGGQRTVRQPGGRDGGGPLGRRTGPLRAGSGLWRRGVVSRSTFSALAGSVPGKRGALMGRSGFPA